LSMVPRRMLSASSASAAAVAAPSEYSMLLCDSVPPRPWPAAGPCCLKSCVAAVTAAAEASWWLLCF
jgi:hypothetical protein